jgi:hypothetical protein
MNTSAPCHSPEEVADSRQHHQDEESSANKPNRLNERAHASPAYQIGEQGRARGRRKYTNVA